jgi:hypothetical protein
LTALWSPVTAQILKKILAQLNGHEMKITDPMLNFTYELRGYQKQIFGWSSVTTSLF